MNSSSRASHETTTFEVVVSEQKQELHASLECYILNTLFVAYIESNGVLNSTTISRKQIVESSRFEVL